MKDYVVKICYNNIVLAIFFLNSSSLIVTKCYQITLHIYIYIRCTN